jgi:hypothetical protein
MTLRHLTLELDVTQRPQMTASSGITACADGKGGAGAADARHCRSHLATEATRSTDAGAALLTALGILAVKERRAGIAEADREWGTEVGMLGRRRSMALTATKPRAMTLMAPNVRVKGRR